MYGDRTQIAIQKFSKNISYMIQPFSCYIICSHACARDVRVSRPLFVLDLGLTVSGLGLGLGLMKFWSRSHTFSSHGLKSSNCSLSVVTSDRVLCSAKLISGRREYFTSEEIVIIDYSSFIISNTCVTDIRI